MADVRTIAGQRFVFRAQVIGDRKHLLIEPEDPALEPLAQAIHGVFLSGAAKVLDAVRRRSGFYVEDAVSFDYEGDVVVATYCGRSVRVPSTLFDALVTAYADTLATLTPSTR